MIFTFICFSIAALLIIALIKTGPSHTKKVPEEQINFRSKEHIIKMFKSHGWDHRKCLELGIEMTEEMAMKPFDWLHKQEDRTAWLKIKHELEKELEKFDAEQIITILHYPLSVDKEKIFRTKKNDAPLIKAIQKKSKELHAEKIETFERKDNIIVTEQGYYAAFFECDLKPEENKKT